MTGTPPRRISFWIAACVSMLCSAVGRSADEITPAERLRARHAALEAQLAQSPFHRPLQVTSSAGATATTADIYAVVEFPFASVRDALSRPQDWCDILTLHLNVKSCRASTREGRNRLDLFVGRKHDQTISDAYPLELGHRITASSRDYLRVALDAEQGPFATRDHRIVVESVELSRARTFIHLEYSHGYSALGRLAMQTYLETVARDKVGFSVVGAAPDGKPRYVAGIRGAVERNTMRYYLALESFLGALRAPPQQRFEKRIRDWFEAVEAYPRQLHELDESEYLDMKRRERARQLSSLSVSRSPNTGAPGPRSRNPVTGFVEATHGHDALDASLTLARPRNACRAWPA